MDITGARWFKSSFSGDVDEGSGCVEVAFLADGQVAVRDSKDRSLPPHIYPAAPWRAFLAAIRTEEFDRRA